MASSLDLLVSSFPSVDNSASPDIMDGSDIVDGFVAKNTVLLPLLCLPRPPDTPRANAPISAAAIVDKLLRASRCRLMEDW